MTRIVRALSLATLATLVLPAALAQYPSELVGFNGPPIDDPGTSQEMFKMPEWSGSTSMYVVPNTAGQYDNNAAFRASGLQTEGAAAMQVFFRWVDPADPNAWVRLTTYNGPERPNPALHLAGKVRFKITNRSELFFGRVGICIGVRETDQNVPQLADGGTIGTVEWVGVSGTAGDPNNPRPVPVLWISPGANPVAVEFDLSTGEVFLDGVSQGGGIAAFTGDGVLSTPSMRGTLEHIAFVNDPADTATLIDVAIDELQFEAPVPDPVLPPTVVAPIVNGDTEVTVTDLMTTVDQVNLLRDGTIILTQNVTSNADVVFTLPQPAVTGEVYTATQRDSVTGTTSPESDPVTVVAEPPPMSFSIVIDEDGDGSCSFDPPGGWEFVGVTDVGSLPGGFLLPQGTLLFFDNAQWQTVDIPLDNPDLVIPWLGGNGQLDPSPTGYYTIDSFWFTLAPSGSVGPHEVFVDAVELLDANDVVIDVIHDMEDGTNYLANARGQSTTVPDSSALSTVTAYDGVTSQRIAWTYATSADESLGLYHNIGYQCGTSPQFVDSGAKLRFHILVRKPLDPNAPPIPEVAGPIVGSQDSVRVYADPNATAVQLYVNGLPEGTPVAPAGGYADFTGLTLAFGDSISATQTIGGVESDFAYPRVLTEQPVAPVVASPIAPGSTSVSVSGAYSAPYATASLVTVYVNGVAHGSAVPAGGSATVPLDVSLVTGDLVTATQTVNGATSPESDPVTVAFTAPVIYKAPAEGDTEVTVLGLTPGADSVVVTVNGTTQFSATPDPGADRAVVPVSGLVAGDVITARYSVGGVDSVESDYEVVTVAATTTILCDDFEYDQATYDATWANSGTAARLQLSTAMNTTPGGAQSLYAPPGITRVEQNLPAPLVPTETEPLVFNVNIYDAAGQNASTVQFAQLIADGSTDWFYMHVGILGWANTDNIHYDFRAVGNGGPNWVDLDQYDAPLRSVGWHNYTVVHKGNRIDIYVDGLLAYKNLTLSSPTTYAIARIGAGYTSDIEAYYDDYCVETGAVRFGQVPALPSQPGIAAPIEDGDNLVTVTGVDSDVLFVQIVDETSTVIGTYSGAIDPNGVVDVPLTRSLVHLERITAEVTNAIGTTASDPLEVGAGNGDILICIGVRETGDTGPLGSPGSSSGEIEWIGAASTANGAPQGLALSPSGSWQTITFDPATDPILGFTGDGVITASRGTLEHLAVAVNAGSAARSSGQYFLYIDNVVNVGADAGADFVIAYFEGYAAGDEVLFQEPTYSGSTAQHLTPLPSASEVTGAYGNPGQAELLTWFFRDTTDQRWARITTFGALNTPSPIIDLTKPVRMDVLLVAATGIPGDIDGDGDVDLQDLSLLLAAYNTCSGDPGYNPAADLNGDGCVDLGDLAILLSNYGV